MECWYFCFVSDCFSAITVTKFPSSNPLILSALLKTIAMTKLLGESTINSSISPALCVGASKCPLLHPLQQVPSYPNAHTCVWTVWGDWGWQVSWWTGCMVIEPWCGCMPDRGLTHQSVHSST